MFTFNKKRQFGDDISDITNHQQFNTTVNLGQLRTEKRPVKASKSSYYELPKSELLPLYTFVAINLAVKSEESQRFSLNDLQHMNNSDFSVKHILDAEMAVLKALDWNLILPTCSELVKYLLVCINPDFDFSTLLSKCQEFIDLCLLDAQLMSYGVVDMAFASIVYSCETLQWNDFLEQWKEIVAKIFGSHFGIKTHRRLPSQIEKMYSRAYELRNKVLSLIQDSNSVREDLASLKQSISHLSSVVQESVRVSLVKGASIVRNDEYKSSTGEEFTSLQVSSDCSHNEVVLRNNICKLKRDISRKIEQNKHLYKIVNHYPNKNEQNQNNAVKIPSAKGDSKTSSIASVLLTKKISSGKEDLSSEDFVKWIESSMSSWIPSFENSSFFDEKKASLHLPDFAKDQKNKEMNKMDTRPESIKERLNFEFQRHHFLERLSCKPIEGKYFCYDPITDVKELDLTNTETARFGKKSDTDRTFNYKPPKTIKCKKRPTSKHRLQKLKPKLSASKPVKKCHKPNVSHSSRADFPVTKPLYLNLNLNDGIERKRTTELPKAPNEISKETINSYRSRNHENLNSEHSSGSKMPWLSQSMVSTNSKPGPRTKYRTTANAFKPPIACENPPAACTSTKHSKHSRMKSHFGVIPVFKHHKHGNSISTTAKSIKINQD